MDPDTFEIFGLALSAALQEFGAAVDTFLREINPLIRYWQSLTADEPELLPCPFCGGDEVEYQQLAVSGEHHVECQQCGVLVAFPVDLTPEEVVIRWNRRETPEE